MESILIAVDSKDGFLQQSVGPNEGFPGLASEVRRQPALRRAGRGRRCREDGTTARVEGDVM